MNSPPEGAMVLFSEKEIEKAIDRIALRMNVQLQGQIVAFACVLKGAIPFTWDLMRRVNLDVRLEYVRVSRYEGMEGGELEFHRTEDSIPDQVQTIVIVDDVLDQGISLNFLKQYYMVYGFNVQSAVLVQKKLDNPPETNADYVGLIAPNKFLIGRGMDYNGRFRELPAIYTLPK